MRLIYLTGLNYPSAIANNQQVMVMAGEFHTILGTGDFTLIVNASRTAGEFAGFQPVTIGCGWKHFRLFYSAWWFFRHAKALVNGRPDVVVYTKDPYFCLISIFFKKIFGYKVVFESHLLFSPMVDWFIARYADAILVLTSHLKTDLVAKGASAQKIAVVPDAVDVAKFNLNISVAEARQKLHLPLDKKLVMYSGSLYVHEWKGVPVLCEAVQLLPPEYLVVLLGARNEAEKKRAEEAGKGRVLVVERKTHTEIPLYLQAADALVLPNTRGNANSEKYTSPLKLFEYMAARRPIVASDLPSIREVLSEKNSFLAEPGSAPSLAKAIVAATNNSGTDSGRIVDQAWNDVKDKTWHARAEDILAFMRTAITMK